MTAPCCLYGAYLLASRPQLIAEYQSDRSERELEPFLPGAGSSSMALEIWMRVFQRRGPISPRLAEDAAPGSEPTPVSPGVGEWEYVETRPDEQQQQQQQQQQVYAGGDEYTVDLDSTDREQEWEACWDAANAAWYWYNRSTGESVWAEPQ
jgi:hypothetical protein